MSRIVFLVFSLVVLLFGCNGIPSDNNTNHKHGVSKFKVTGFNQDSMQVCLQDKLVLPVYKQIVLNTYSFSEDGLDKPEFFALIDSVQHARPSYRKFYLSVLTKVMDKADGAFSEALSVFAKDYIEQHSIDFFTLFANNNTVSEKDLQRWSDFVMMELTLDDVTNIQKKIADYEKRIVHNCQGSNSEVIDKCDEFCNYMEGYIP